MVTLTPFAASPMQLSAVFFFFILVGALSIWKPAAKK